MNSLLMEQSSMKSHIVVNYSSSYGRFLFRSPNSPPPSPSPSPPSSMTSITQLFHSSRAGGSAFKTLPPPSSPLLPVPPHQPPLLPHPRPATLPSTARSRRLQPKRKAKAAAATMTTKKEMLSAAIEKGEGRRELSAEELVYSMSPPPSSLPLPRFALVRAKAGGGGGGAGECFVLK